MVCPFCSQSIQEMWQPFSVTSNFDGTPLPKPEFSAETITRLAKRQFAYIDVQLFWATCPKCDELMVKLHKTTTLAGKSTATHETLEKAPKQEATWLALPQRRPAPSLNSLVPEGMARDYREAFWILDDSPRMSAVLSRRILADLLELYGKISQYTLAKQIDKFIGDQNHPARLRDNLHYLRELGDFSAHTKTDGTGKIIEVTRDEAEWTLRIVAELFDYFIVDPETDKAFRTRIDQKLKEAGRKPIQKLAELENDANPKDI